MPRRMVELINAADRVVASYLIELHDDTPSDDLAFADAARVIAIKAGVVGKMEARGLKARVSLVRPN